MFLIVIMYFIARISRSRNKISSSVHQLIVHKVIKYLRTIVMKLRERKIR